MPEKPRINVFTCRRGKFCGWQTARLFFQECEREEPIWKWINLINFNFSFSNSQSGMSMMKGRFRQIFALLLRVESELCVEFFSSSAQSKSRNESDENGKNAKKVLSSIWSDERRVIFSAWPMLRWIMPSTTQKNSANDIWMISNYSDENSILKPDNSGRFWSGFALQLFTCRQLCRSTIRCGLLFIHRQSQLIQFSTRLGIPKSKIQFVCAPHKLCHLPICCAIIDSIFLHFNVVLRNIIH